MQIYSSKFRTLISWVMIVTLTAIACSGCDMRLTNRHTHSSNQVVSFLSQPEAKCVWRRMATSFKMHSHYNNPRVQTYIKRYSAENAHHLVKYSKQASPYLYHIVDILEEQGMPHELALLPIVESEYKPSATSHVGAAGLWQLAPAVGRMYGLKHDHWYDGRRDVELATRAALSHLKVYHDKFNGDWLLALAAYNAGDGRVRAAIKANQRAGKPTDYWSLSLPKETQHFVPKFLALVYLVQNAPDLNIELAHIPNQPHFTKVDLVSPIDIDHAAELAGIEVKEFKQLNPALRAHATHPHGPYHINIPAKNVALFKRNYQVVLKNPKPIAPKVVPNSNGQKFHTVAKGDTLNLIASRYSTTVKSIKAKNSLKSDIIRSGQKLAI